MTVHSEEGGPFGAFDRDETSKNKQEEIAFVSFEDFSIPPKKDTIFSRFARWFRSKKSLQPVTGYSSGFAKWRSKTWRRFRGWMLGSATQRGAAPVESFEKHPPVAKATPSNQKAPRNHRARSSVPPSLVRRYSALPDWYAQWSLDGQMLFWLGLAFLFAGAAVGVAYVLPILGLIATGLSLVHLGLLAAWVSVGTLYVGLWLDGLWATRAHRPPRAQFYRSLLFTLLSLTLCLLVGAWFLPLKVWTAFIATLFPSIAKWAVGWKIAVLVALPLGWAMLTGALSSALAKFAKYCRSGQAAWWRLGHCFQGMSWGVLLVGAAVPAIFMGYYFATHALITSALHFLTPWLGPWTVPACVAVAPLAGGVVMSILNSLWRGEEQPVAGAVTPVLPDVGGSEGTKCEVLCQLRNNKMSTPACNTSVPWNENQGSDNDDENQSCRISNYTHTPRRFSLGDIESPQRQGATPISPTTTHTSNMQQTHS